MTLREAALRYTEFLLRQMRIAGARGNWLSVADLADRFERVMANLPPVARPLVWDGDYS